MTNPNEDVSRQTMRGLRLTGGETCELAEYEIPELGPEDARVRVSISAVCGSDLPHFRKPLDELGRRAFTVPGHEAVGVIDHLPANAEGLAVGDRVIVYQHSGEGHCEHCLRDEPMFCAQRQTLGNHRHGGNAEYVVAPVSSLIPIPDDIEDRLAALISCNFGTAFTGFRKTGGGLGDRVVVVGLGPVGACVVAAAASTGAEVIAVDPLEGRRELAVRLGARHAIDPVADDPVDRVHELTAGGAEVVVECSANASAQQQAMKAVRTHGTVLLLGANNAMEIDPGTDVIRKELRVLGSWVFKPYEADLVFRAARDTPALSELLTEPLVGENAANAFALASKGRVGKTLIQWS